MVHDEVDNARINVKPRKQIGSNSQQSLVSNNLNSDDGASCSHTQMIEDIAIEPERNFESSDESDVTNDAANEESHNEGRPFEYLQLYQANEAAPKDLKDDLRVWLSENSISQRAANDLIAIFRNHGHSHELKKDVRTLMKTPRFATGKIVRGNGGAYIHEGIANGLIRSVNKYFETIPDMISFHVNCDGMSFSRSSTSQFWPLLAAIETNFYTEPFVIGLFHGLSKPNDWNIFISPFVVEMGDLQTNGIIIMSGQKINVRLSAIVCDAPARAYLTMTKSHSGYFGCSKCTQEGH